MYPTNIYPYKKSIQAVELVRHTLERQRMKRAYKDYILQDMKVSVLKKNYALFITIITIESVR